MQNHYNKLEIIKRQKKNAWSSKMVNINLFFVHMLHLILKCFWEGVIYFDDIDFFSYIDTCNFSKSLPTTKRKCKNEVKINMVIYFWFSNETPCTERRWNTTLFYFQVVPKGCIRWDVKLGLILDCVWIIFSLQDSTVNMLWWCIQCQMDFDKNTHHVTTFCTYAYFLFLPIKSRIFKKVGNFEDEKYSWDSNLIFDKKSHLNSIFHAQKREK